jgi:uncharacterized protein
LAKFLLLIALVIVVYFLFRGFRRDASIQERQPKAAPERSNLPEDMVRCSVCGVHLPRSESFTSRGRFFCTDEHRRLGGGGSGNN